MIFSMFTFVKAVFSGILLVSILLSSQVTAQIYFDTHGDSRLWLEGSSTVHRFDCAARSIQGTAYIDGHQEPEASAADALSGPTDTREMTGPDMDASYQDESFMPSSYRTGAASYVEYPASGDTVAPSADLHVLLKIPVKSFDCRHSRMNRDMYEALKSDKYDYITFEFENAERLPAEDVKDASMLEEGYVPFQVEGVLNVAGVDRLVDLVVWGRTHDEGRYHIKGHKEISMQDYEIEPPTALRGLIRAHDDLTVFFDLHVMETHRD